MSGKFISALMFFVFLWTGCATIFLPGKQNISIKTGDSKASVFIDNEEVGNGSNVRTKVKKNGIKQIVIQSPDYKDAYYCLVPGKRPLAFWFLIPLNCFNYYGWLIDLTVVKNKIFEKENKFPPVYKYPNRGNESKYIYLSAIKLDIKNKTKDMRYYSVSYTNDLESELTKKEKESQQKEIKQETKEIKKKGVKKTLNTEDNTIQYDNLKFSDDISRTLKKSGFVDTVNKVFADLNNTLVLEGVITKMNSFSVLCYIVGVTGCATGNNTAQVSSSSFLKIKPYMKWYIKNSYHEIIDSVSTMEYSGDFILPAGEEYDKTIEKCIGDAVDNSFFELYNNPRFTKYLKQESDLKINNTVLSIEKPKKTVHEISDAAATSVIIKTKEGHGSGFAVSHDGYIITNFHVIAGKYFDKLSEPKVVLPGGEEIPAKIVRYNRFRDLALLKIEHRFELAFNINNAKSYKNLQEVYTIGAPKSVELGQSVSLGLISNERNVNKNTVLQLSMSVNPGNSGGPLFDKEGHLHGVIVSKLIGWATEGVGFAIPSHLIFDYLNIKYSR